MCICTICQKGSVNPQVLNYGQGFCYKCINFNICPVCNTYIKFKIPNLAVSGNPLNGKSQTKYPVTDHANLYWVETDYEYVVDYLGERESRGLKSWRKSIKSIKCMFMVDDKGYIKGVRVTDVDNTSYHYDYFKDTRGI
jgi:hypothetical protein